MKPEIVKIDDQEYVRRDVAAKPSGSIKIVILQRGWVVVGYYSQEDSRCTVEKASMVRVWGTSKGLGEIANGGPTSKTVLDPCPPISFHELTVIATIDCVDEKWNTKLL